MSGLVWFRARGGADGRVALQLSRGGAVMGTTLLPNLALAMGNNSLTAQGNFTVRKGLPLSLRVGC